MIKFYFFLFLILLMQNQSNSYAKDESMTGEEIIKKIGDFALFSTDKNHDPYVTREVNDNIWNKKAVLDPSKKYTINESFDLCPHNYLYDGSGRHRDEDCDEKTKICKCQNQEGIDDKSQMVKESNIKLGKLIKYYKDDRVECINISGNHHSCFLFQDEDGKFAYIIPSKYNLKPTNDPADLQKESFIAMVDQGSFIHVDFSDEEGICKNAKEKFDKKTKETYLDCTAEQRK
jgi:hypothetical protein